MNTKPELPEGWSLPEDLADQVSEELKKKTITPQDAIQDALAEIARDIAIIEPNPVDWGWWVKYFLDQLEEESEKKIDRFQFNSMLDSLVSELKDRIRNNK
jgi:hypothetical protein